MKQLLSLFLAAALLTGCSKSNAGAEPVTLAGTWTWSEQDYTKYPKDGSPSTTTHSTGKAYTETWSFDNNGSFVASYNGRPNAGVPYTYSGNTLTIASNPSFTSVFTVVELSAHRLIVSETSEDAAFNFKLADTYTR